MTIVKESKFGVDCNTHLWLTDRAFVEINKYFKKKGKNKAKEYWNKINRHTKNGLWHAERGGIVVHEKDGVYRVGYVNDLFRLIGFYENGSKKDFIGILTFKKHGQQLTDGQKKQIDEIARIKRDSTWQKER